MSRRTDSSSARIDRTRSLSFSFDGRPLTGHPGDTLASALLANGVEVVSRGPYRDRPRGILAAGVEEPNALVGITTPGASEPISLATTVELYDGLEAHGLTGGKGRALVPTAERRCDHRHRHCDVLVVGGGVAGLTAALEAAATGARVVLADQQAELGGAELGAGGAAARSLIARLEAFAEVVVLRRATVLGLYESDYALIAERRTEHLGPAAPADRVRARLWHVRARRVVLATGAIERPLVFSGNDRPGVMLAGAARAYVNRYAVATGRRAVVFTTNDSAYGAAEDLFDGGVEVAALIDARHEPPADLAARLRERGVEVVVGAAVAATAGSPGVEAVTVVGIDDADRLTGASREIPCDLLAVSGGWSPTLHLFAQAGGRLAFDPAIAAHVPAEQHPTVSVVGAAAGRHVAAARALWAVPPITEGRWDEHYVDLARDVTVTDMLRAVDAGLRSPEHVKRYTTIGTGSDQGKTANVNALGILAGLTGTAVHELAPTTYRPPYTPVPFDLLAGRERGALHDPVRVTAMHPWHEAHGAVFENVGQWKRPYFYPRDGEDMDAAVLRECRAAREGVAMMDASTLGKIDVQGPDAGEFLDRVYTNLMSTLPVGSCRYGVLCRSDGMVFDDGVVLRLAEDRYVTTTTTGGAATVLEWLEDWLQTEWPQLRVRLTSVTDHWAVAAVVGPRAREVLAPLVDPDVALDADAFPFMAVRDVRVAGVPARLCRVSFSGELAFEVHVPARWGLVVWEALMEAGASLGITPYGTETMHVLRAEKGYVIVGQDTDGTVTPQDAAMRWVVSKKKPFFVGRRSHRRVDTLREDRRQLVGLLPDDPAERLPEGAQLLLRDDAPCRSAGHVTSSYRSAALERTFALALLEGGERRCGETVHVPLGDRTVTATVTGSVLFDPEGARRDGEPA